MKIIFFALLIILKTTFCFSQEKIEDSKTIQGQFERIFRISTSYQTYKVISKDEYNELKRNVLDSLENSKKSIIEKEKFIKEERESVLKLQEALSKTKKDLENTLQKENSISLFGISLHKATYNFILWFLITLLGAGLGYFVYKFSKSNILTKEAAENLLHVEQEFDIHRKKSLEREQKLRRQLQDEINKHKNS